jgi:glycosyltransferase involved in cell wall biosynthesis
MADSPQVTAVSVNYRTPDLITRAVRSLREHYPHLPLLLIDNGSGDESVDRLMELQAAHPDVTDLVLNTGNRHHGPAMDQALRTVDTPLVLFLDSDIVVRRGGFVEAMARALAGTPRSYAAGKRIWMNRRGFDVDESAGGIPYLRPICLMVRRPVYLTLPGFRRHGAPCLVNMRAAHRQNLELIPFPVDDYVEHTGRGTAGRHGYHLGLRGKVNHLLNSLGV